VDRAVASKQRQQPPPRSGLSIRVDEGSVVSFNQQGGITAREVKITQGVQEPRLRVEAIRMNEPLGDKFVSRFRPSITSQFAIPNLYLAVKAPSILDMDAAAQRSGVFMEGLSGKRERVVFVNLVNAYGDYVVRVTSRSRENVEVLYDFRSREPGARTT
jgi:hypothetical protein